MVYDTNAYLTQDQMTVNAQYILDFFTGKGWSKNAVCGMLGNMQTESTINFGIWQGLDSSNTSGGFGLVQWTPSTKYTDWAGANGYGTDNVSGELQRIIYEIANNLQWIQTSSYPISFQAFTTSTDTPENLAQAWLYNYERPASLDQPARSAQARSWFNTLTGGGSGGGGNPAPTPTAQDPLIHMYLSGALNWR